MPSRNDYTGWSWYKSNKRGTEDSGWSTGTKLNKCGTNLNARKSKVGMSMRKSHEPWQKTFNRPCYNQLTPKHWNKKPERYPTAKGGPSHSTIENTWFGIWISQHIWNGSVKTSQGQLQSYSNEENPPDCTLKGFDMTAIGLPLCGIQDA